jgi:hypothetical protein
VQFVQESFGEATHWAKKWATEEMSGLAILSRSAPKFCMTWVLILRSTHFNGISF